MDRCKHDYQLLGRYTPLRIIDTFWIDILVNPDEVGQNTTDKTPDRAVLCFVYCGQVDPSDLLFHGP